MNEELAEEILAALPAYRELMDAWLTRVEAA